MSSMDERVAFIEGRLMEQTAMFDDIRQTMGRIGTKMDARFDAVERRFDAVDRRFDTVERRFDGRFGEVSGRFGEVNDRFNQADKRFTDVGHRFDRVDSRLDAMLAAMHAGFAALDRKIDDRFTFLVRLQIGTLVTIVAVLLTALFAR